MSQPASLGPAPRPRPGIMEVQAYVGGKAAAAGGVVPVKLSANENALGASPAAIAAYASAATQLHRYPDGNSEQLRAAIARRFNLDPGRIVCGAGSDELIALMVRAYAGPGDEVLVSRHGFLIYKLTALSAGAHVVEAPEHELCADVDALLARVTSRTRLVFLANPNNPTGSWLSAAELARLHAGLPEDVVLVVDGAYAEFATDAHYGDGTDLAERFGNVVVTRTFSKLHGLAALRVGWLFGSAGIADVLNRVRGPFNVALPAQLAAVAALDDQDHQAASRAHNAHWLPWLTAELAGLGLDVRPSAGNFVLARFAEADAAAAASAALESRGLLVRGMTAYGLPEALRISVGLEPENRALVAALTAHLRHRPA